MFAGKIQWPMAHYGTIVPGVVPIYGGRAVQWTMLITEWGDRLRIVMASQQGRKYIRIRTLRIVVGYRLPKLTMAKYIQK